MTIRHEVRPSIHDDRPVDSHTVISTYGQIEERFAASPARSVHATTGCVWGMEAPRLHDAWWRSRGVQVVVRGVAERIDSDAELFLLLEPGRLVDFPLKSIVEEMTWNGATLIRVRLQEPVEERYDESIVSKDGTLLRIERHYRPHGHRSMRLGVTRSRRLARIWQREGSRRAQWRAIRSRVSEVRFRTLSLEGVFYHADRQDERDAFVQHLVANWSDPGRVIRGIHEVAEGVWAPWRASYSSDAMIIGPAWLGTGVDTSDDDVLVGPTVQFDRDDSDDAAYGLRRIADIDEHYRDPGEDARALKEGGRTAYRALKRTMDIAGAMVALLIFAPIMIFVAMCILIDDGRPILFGHTRQTRGGRNFKCWKFRTMYRNADDIKARLQAMNVCDGPQFYIADDPRITRTGRWIRRFQLDELPQFINVLKGDMSLVGPRPSPDNENQYCPAWREIRLSVRPGLTGMWQVERTREPGRDFQEWIQFDIEYVRQASIALDVRICLLTLRQIVFRRTHHGT